MDNAKAILAVVLVVGAAGVIATAVPPQSGGSNQIQVTLAPAQINEIFQNEPGLLLEFKRVLVQRASDMGRIVEPAELTDEAVFELVEASAEVRAMATAEIVDRGYLELRPKRGEARAGQGTPSAPQPAATREARATSKAPALPPGLTPRKIEEQKKLAARGGLPAGAASMPIAPADLGALFAASGSGTPGGSPGAASLAAVSQSAMSTDASAMDPSLAVYQPEASRAAEATQMQAELSRQNASRSAGGDSEPAQQAVRPAPSSGLERRSQPYRNVPSLYDLYQQMAPRSEQLTRFGADIFTNGSGNVNDLPMDVPVSPDYVIGPGDALNIELWGSVSTRLQRIVDREGRLALPEVGPVLVAGRTLGDAQRYIQNALGGQFQDIGADVSLVRLRMVRVYVVGEVERPGPYDVSALSTPLNAVYSAGGPTSRGSIRVIRHMRADKLVQEVDVYDLLLRGVRGDVQRLESGDTILIPPAEREIRIEGMVRRPAIYELRDETNVEQALALAGGILPTGTPRHIRVERVETHQRVTMLSVDLSEQAPPEEVQKALQTFQIREGDSILVSPILTYNRQTVYLDGHVFRPGKYPYQEGLKVGSLLRSAGMMLPEPYRKYGEIVRLREPDFRPEVLAFNLGAVLDGAEDYTLQPMDTVRVFGRYDFEDPPAITVSGEVRSPGVHTTNGVTHLRDAIYLAGGPTPDARLDEVQVFRRLERSKVKVLTADLGKALNGDPIANLRLEPLDRVVVHRNLARLDPPAVYIRGEVANPGKYPLGEGMTAADLVRAAGGFKRSAYTELADLSRNPIAQGRQVTGDHMEVQIAAALSGESAADVPLVDGDTLTIRQLAGWNDMGAAITVRGEVLHPGAYGISEGERLSSILRRAGGFRETSYPVGAVLERVQVREFAEKSRDELVRRIEAAQPTPSIGTGTNISEQAAFAQAFFAQKQQILARLRNEPVSGRQVIRISSDISKWEGTPADIQVRAGDVIVIPKRPNFVMISGQVFNASAVTYTPKKDAGWYLKQAGGATSMADTGQIFVVRADGSVVGSGKGFWKKSVLGLKMQPGDVIVVPEKVIGGSPFWRSLLATAQVATSLALTANLLAGL